MEETHVVTCFLRNGTDVLLFRRSEDVGSYAGLWGAVAGHAEGAPDEAARREIREETGLDDDAVTLVRAGDPFDVVDENRGTRWVVHPYLFDCDVREVDPNWETAEWEWTSPVELASRETVPDLDRSYAAVAPTVETVRADESHGSAYVSLRALEVLRDAAAALTLDDPSWGALAGLARDLRAARPGMAAVANRVNRVASRAVDAGRTPAAVLDAAGAVLEAVRDADGAAAETAADAVAGDLLCTLSRSGTVRAAVEAAAPEGVLLAESRPGGEGVEVAESLAEAGFDVTLTTDAAAPGRVADGAVDAVLVGADAVLPDGAVVNKVGTRALALAAAAADRPVYAVCASDKVSPDREVSLDDADPARLYDGDAPVTVENPLFEVTPADAVTAVLTERGRLDPDDVASVAAEHRERARWDAE